MSVVAFAAAAELRRLREDRADVLDALHDAEGRGETEIVERLIRDRDEIDAEIAALFESMPAPRDR